MKNITRTGMLLLAGILLASASYSYASDILTFGSVTLRPGSTGQYVMNLQTVLNQVSPATTPLVVDGHFGSGTKSVVAAFQSTSGLTPDGVVGVLTKQLLVAWENQHQGTTPVSPIKPVPMPSPSGQTSCSSRPITSFATGHQITTIGVPLFEFTSPQSNQVYKVGSTMVITWINCNPTNTRNISLTLQEPNGRTLSIASAVPLATQSYSFTVPYSLGAGSSYSITGTDGALSDSNYNTSTTVPFTISGLGLLQ